jgi:predicted RNA-binding Zn-ribbon protein involved in translation (DUF1610 family)
MTPTRITSYSQDYMDQLTVQFLAKFKADRRPFAAKLRVIHIPKGTYSHLINGKGTPRKTTIEAMRAYLENRPPKFTLVMAGEAYCFSCENIVPLADMRTRWECLHCRSEIAYRSKVRTGYYERYKVVRRIRNRTPGEYRDRILRHRRGYYLRKNYGALAKCVEIIRLIRKEVPNETL